MWKHNKTEKDLRRPQTDNQETQDLSRKPSEFKKRNAEVKKAIFRQNHKKKKYEKEIQLPGRKQTALDALLGREFSLITSKHKLVKVFFSGSHALQRLRGQVRLRNLVNVDKIEISGNKILLLHISWL